MTDDSELDKRWAPYGNSTAIKTFYQNINSSFLGLEKEIKETFKEKFNLRMQIAVQLLCGYGANAEDRDIREVFKIADRIIAIGKETEVKNEA